MKLEDQSELFCVSSRDDLPITLSMQIAALGEAVQRSTGKCCFLRVL